MIFRREVSCYVPIGYSTGYSPIFLIFFFICVPRTREKDYGRTTWHSAVLYAAAYYYYNNNKYTVDAVAGLTSD